MAGTAYDNNLPCLNPHCKSHGQPHPNCRCYAGMSKGGIADYFCSSTNPHQSDCQYFEEGGDVLPSFNSTVPVVPQDASSASSLPSFEDTKPLTDSSSLPSFEDTTPIDSNKYGTPGQQLLTGLEGAAQGYAGPIATLAEKGLSSLGVPNLKNEDITGRSETNPWVHGLSEAAGLGTGFLTGTGEAGLLVKGASRLLPETAELSKIGSAVIKGAIENGAIQGGDEISKYLLGQGGDASTVAASVIAAAGAGGVLGLAGRGASKGLEALQASKIGTKALSFIQGAGARSLEVAHGISADEVREALKNSGTHIPSFKIGEKAAQLLNGNGLGHILGLSQGQGRYEKEGAWGTLKGVAVGELEGFLLSVVGAQAAKKFLVPLAIKAMSNETSINWMNALNSSKKLWDGAQSLSKGVENLFKVGSQQGINSITSEVEREKLKKYIEDGQQNKEIQQELNQQPSQPAFAEGGSVPSPDATPIPWQPREVPLIEKKLDSQQEPWNYQYLKNKNTFKAAEGGSVASTPGSSSPANPMLQGTDFWSTHYPEVGMQLGMAKGRVNSYLNSVRPLPNQPKLAFDAEPDQRAQERSYKKALDIAAQPLSILNHIKEGTLEPEHVKHLSSLFPELKQHLDKKLTEKISEAQISGEKPTYKVQQGMSMFLGTPLNSSLTPSSIQSAQATFLAQAAQRQAAQPAPKKTKASLTKVASQYQTGDQAAASRQQQTG